jgi:hypothetical protein
MNDLREFDGPSVRGPALVPRDPWWARALLWCYFKVACAFGRWIDRVFADERKPPC